MNSGSRCVQNTNPLRWGLLLAVLLVVFGAVPAPGATFTINELTDEADFIPGDGQCDTDILSGGRQCTLRAAIQEANVFGSGHRILMAPSLSGQIDLTADLPEIRTDMTIAGVAATRVIIDGSSQRCFTVLGSSLTLLDLTVQRCQGDWEGGGAVLFTSDGQNPDTGRLLVERSHFYQNQVADRGGAIAVYSADKVEIRDSSFFQNYSQQDGGALWMQGSPQYVSNSTLSHNLAGRHGGGMWLGTRTDSEFVNLTITWNEADYDGLNGGDGGGVYVFSATPRPNFGNVVLDDNIDDGGEGPDCFGTLQSLGNNLVSNGFGCTLADPVDEVLGADSKLEDFGFHEGFTMTRPPLDDSPVIDRGKLSLCSNGDQRGFPRPQDGGNGPKCDIGAAEYSHCDNGAQDADERGEDCGGGICDPCVCAVAPTSRIWHKPAGSQQGGTVYEHFYQIQNSTLENADSLVVREDVFPDYVNIATSTPKTITLEGGYDCLMTAGSDAGHYSTIKGSLTIGGQARVIASNMVIR